jgi:hypothetical protein
MESRVLATVVLLLLSASGSGEAWLLLLLLLTGAGSPAAIAGTVLHCALQPADQPGVLLLRCCS